METRYKAPLFRKLAFRCAFEQLA